MEDLKLTAEQRREVERQWEIIRRGTVEIVPEDQLKERIARSVVSGKPLKIKLGMDPSSPDIHVGSSGR